MRRVAYYSRVSTVEQFEHGFSLEAMRERCEHYIKSQLDYELVKVYEDQGVSGTVEPSRRPALSRLLNDIQSKEVIIDTVLVWKLDRLGRSLRDVLNLEFMFRRQKITLESCTEKIDSNSPSGKALFSTVCAFAEFESSQTAERTYNVMRSKVGEIHLGGKAPFGYKLINGKLYKDNTTAPIVELIFQQYLKKRNLTKVAEFLNSKGVLTSCGKKWCHKKVKRILQSFKLTGNSVWAVRISKSGRKRDPREWVRKPNTHEALISSQMFEKVQALLLPDT